MKIVYVRWEDARAIAGPRPLSEMNQIGPLVMETVGIFLSEDSEVIRLAQDIYTYDPEEGALLRDTSIIPQKFILSKRIIEINTGQRKARK